MPDLHPEVLALIEAGPQKIFREWDGQRFRDVENWHEFARRIALRQQELDAQLAENPGYFSCCQNGCRLAAAIRRRGKP